MILQLASPLTMLILALALICAVVYKFIIWTRKATGREIAYKMVIGYYNVSFFGGVIWTVWAVFKWIIG